MKITRLLKSSHITKNPLCTFNAEGIFVIIGLVDFVLVVETFL